MHPRSRCALGPGRAIRPGSGNPRVSLTNSTSEPSVNVSGPECVVEGEHGSRKPHGILQLAERDLLRRHAAEEGGRGPSLAPALSGSPAAGRPGTREAGGG